MTSPMRISRNPEEFELYRIVSDYEALQDGFWDRIDDLEAPLNGIPDFADGEVQKLLSKNPGKASTKPRNCRHASARRTFGWESLPKLLEKTGLVLLLAVDDQRFASVKDQLAKPKRPPRSTSMRAKTKEMPINIEELLQQKVSERIKEMRKSDSSAKRQARRQKQRARQRRASHAARKRWSKVK